MFLSLPLGSGYGSNNNMWLKTCGLESENLVSVLDPRCKMLAAWSISFLYEHRDEVVERLKLTAEQRDRIYTSNGLARSFTSLTGSAHQIKCFKEEFVNLPVQTVVSICSYCCTQRSAPSLMVVRAFSS